MRNFAWGMNDSRLEEFSYKMNLNYNITSGNAGNILVILDDNVKGKLGKFGEVIDSFIIDQQFSN